MSTRYVQHKSGQGEKWPLTGCDNSPYAWRCESPNEYYFYLPKSEYRLVEPPEQWVDVTAECALTYGIPVHEINGQALYIMGACRDMLAGYRLRKIPLKSMELGPQHWVFIVERRAP